MSTLNLGSLNDLDRELTPRNALMKSMASYLFETLDNDRPVTERKEEEPVKVIAECFCEDGFYVGDYIEASYEDAYFSVTCAEDVLSLIVDDTFKEIQKKIEKKEMPKLIMQHCINIFDLIIY